MSFSDQELEEFKAEALELLDVAEKSLLALDKGAEFRSAFDTIFRGFHNLKGASGMMELHKLQSHTHELENILMGFKNETSIPKDHISLFLRGIDAARNILDGKEVTFDFNPSPGTATAAATATPAATKEAPPKIEQPVATAPAQPDPSATLNQPEISDSAMGEFVAEVEEIVERVSVNLQLLEKGSHTKNSIDELYRDVHSLKGSAYLFSFAKLGDVAHAMESSLEKVRNGTHLPSKDLSNLLFKCIEVVETLVERIRQKVSDADLDSGITDLALALALESESLHEVPMTAPEATTALPEPPQPEAIKLDPISAATPETNGTPQPTAITQGPTQTSEQPMSDSNTPSAAPTNATSQMPSDSAPVQVKEKESEGSSSIRVPVALLDNLMTLMGEMVLVRNQVLQYSNRSEDLEFLSMSKRLNVVTSEIQGEMMKTRMQPIGNVLSKFNRVVRDLSQELGKDISLNLFGAETELDKSLLEAIKDPLTHIVRNSCDHGIETPEIRRKAGKSGAGAIGIKAYHEGGQVVIEVYDDGKGLHKDVLIKKAIEKGLLNQAQAAKLSEKEIFNLIFAPGFSTAAKITNVSGRGVGMDVVRTNIERIGGTVDLSSVAGSGTSIKIKIPLTLAIVPALIVKCGNGTFAIPQVKLEELVRVDQSSAENKIEILHGAPVFRLRGNILPLVELNTVLGIETANAKNYENSIVNIAVLNAEHCSFGVIIDGVEDTADIVVKPLNRLLKSLAVYSGATILGDGSVALILDVLGISKVAKIGRETFKEGNSDTQLVEKNRLKSEQQDFLLVRLNSPTKHAIVLNFVNRLEEFKKKNIEYSGTQRVIRYRDLILPIISANDHLGYPAKESDREEFPVVVIERAGALYGLEVEEILDTLSIAAELDTALVKHPGIYGNLNTKDELIVVIDPFELISSAFPDRFKKPTIEIANSNSQPQLTSSVDSFEESGHFHPSKLLLVEDTVFFRKAIKTVLEKGGYEVLTANDGKEAMDILNNQDATVDLIVSDIEMPNMNGFELATNVRKHGRYSGIPLLAVSSRADSKYLAAGKKAGFDLYLEKLKPTLLLNAVSELIKKNRNAA